MFLKISEDQSNSQRTLEGDIISLRNALPLPVPVILKYIDLKLERVAYLLTTFSGEHKSDAYQTKFVLVHQDLCFVLADSN